MPAQPAMPIVANAPTRPNGDPYTEDDRQFWELNTTYLPEYGAGRGIREHRHLDFPKMIYKAKDERGERESFERMTVGSEREMQDVMQRDPAWKMARTDATAHLVAKRDAEARAAAEVAHGAQRMTAKAQKDYDKRSAESSKHVTE